MRPYIALRCPAVWLGLGTLVVLLGAPAAPAADPVEALRQVLLEGRDLSNPGELKSRRQALPKAAAAVQNLGDLARALVLPEWGYEGFDTQTTNSDQAV